MWIKQLGGFSRAKAFSALCSTAYAQTTITDYELDTTIKAYDSSLIQPFITAMMDFLNVIDTKYPLLPPNNGLIAVQDRLHSAYDMTQYWRTKFEQSLQSTKPEWMDIIDSLSYKMSEVRAKLKAQLDAKVDAPYGLWTPDVEFPTTDFNIWKAILDFYIFGEEQCSMAKCAPKDVVTWLFSGKYDPVTDQWQFTEEDLATRVAVLRAIASTLEKTSAEAVEEMEEFLTEFKKHPGVAVDPTVWANGSFKVLQDILMLFASMFNDIADAMENIQLNYQLGRDD
ncbi:hypothetical protein TWF696_008554 [Orbilia brochopaga]|uniref:Uncharacterized protein n=1 Tax=Orbilia brochopaga TaxID=3140254 RepID=A0AAV9UHD8_9PEZI